MATRIEVGISDGYAYLGIQPPLNEGQLAMLDDARQSDAEIPADFVTVSPLKHGEPYSQASLPVERFGGLNGAAQHMMRVAHRLGRLMGSDSEVVIVPRPQRITRGRYLFGGQAARIDE